MTQVKLDSVPTNPRDGARQYSHLPLSPSHSDEMGKAAQQGHSPESLVAGNVGLLVDDIAEHGVRGGPTPTLDLPSMPPFAGTKGSR